MSEVLQQRVALPTGVTLNVATAGPTDAPPVILLHGFPESHRTWRELVPLLEDRLRLIMPDQRGFGASDRPAAVEAYRAETLIEDIFALAEVLGVERFALVGHDWGGAIAWPAAMRGDPRLTRLAIVNAPHPAIFQQSVIADPNQRAASQYIRRFREPGFEQAPAAMGWDAFFDKSFASHAPAGSIPAGERARYIADWSAPGGFEAMLNWYRASQLIVPAPGEEAEIPAWTAPGGLPKITVPTLVVWGMEDKALLPLQLNGLGEWVEKLAIHRIPGAGHFVPWEDPEGVAAALKPFLLGEGGA